MVVQERIERLCIEKGWYIFSPRVELTLTKDSTKEDHKRCFFLNNHGLKCCRLILANVEGLDTGTIWEMGAAYAYGKQVVVYSPNPDRKLNVMLAQGAQGFLAGWDEIESFLTPPTTTERDFNWEAVKSWVGEVF
jgi:nucleoside 2-deoxyribosyltransferase